MEIRKGKYPPICILIPVLGTGDIHKTIESIIAQKYSRCEIYILHNGIQNLPEGRDFVERTVCDYDDSLIRQLFIKKLGKANALNIGICRSKSDLVCVLDADCILQKDALENAVKRFDSEDVVEVGGRLIVKKDDSSFLESIQFYEYTKTFQLNRMFFDWLNAQCLISGAFGIFRRSALLKISGYDTDTVGEDMEIILRLQKELYCKSKKTIVYEPAAICYTMVSHSPKRLMNQRDR